MTYRALPCFKAYDVRGRIGIDLDGDVAYRVGRAVAQHFAAETVVVGYDAWETSPEFAACPSSGEMNFKVDDAGRTIENVLSDYCSDARSLDETDGVSLAFKDWRFNLRRSNTEPLVRLKVEGKSKADALSGYLSAIADVLGEARVRSCR